MKTREELDWQMPEGLRDILKWNRLDAERNPDHKHVGNVLLEFYADRIEELLAEKYGERAPIPAKSSFRISEHVTSWAVPH